MSSDFTTRVARIYEHYAPEKVGNVPNLLANNQGREQDLINKLVEKYGPEPPIAQKVNPTPAIGTSPQTTSNKEAPSIQPASPLQHQASLSVAPSSPNQVSASITSPIAPQAGLGVVDPMRDLRIQVRDDCGFLTREHEIMWEDAWMGKMPLGTLRKTWDMNRSVLLSGLGSKMSSHARPVKRWQRRFFVLAPPFLYYFDSDQPASICKGALYLDRATITKNPETLEGHPEIPETLKGAIEITSRVTKKPLELDRRGDYSTFIITFESEKQRTTWFNMLTKVSLIGDVGSTAKTFGAYPMSGPSMLNTIMSSGSPLAVPLTAPGSPVATQQAAMTMMMMAGADQPIQAPPGMSQAQFQQQQMRQLSDIGVTPHMIAAAQGTNRASHPLFNNFAVDAPEIKRRIARLARDRDPVLMAEVFLQFVQDHFDNAPLLWKLMASLEEVEPFTGPTYNHAQAQLNSMGGYGGVYGGNMAGPTSQQSLINMHRHLFGTRSENNAVQPQLQQDQYIAPALQFDTSQMSARMMNEQYQRQPASAMLRAAAAQPLPMADSQQFSFSSRNSSPIRGLNTSQGAPPGTTFGNSNSHLGVDDGDWQRRIGRIRDRKHLVERLMRELPPQ